MNMKLFLKRAAIVAAILFISSDMVSGQHQATITEIEETIQSFFEAMRSSDESVIRTIMTDSVTLLTVMEPDQKGSFLRESDIESFLQSVGSALPGTLDE